MVSLDDANILTWRINDFADRFNSSIPGDHWISDVYSMENEYFGHVELCLRFYPHGRHRNRSCLLRLRLYKADVRLKVKMNVESWIEDAAGNVGKMNSICLNFGNLRAATWSQFLTPEELQTFISKSPVFIRCSFPHPIAKVGSLFSKPTFHRWTIADIKTYLDESEHQVAYNGSLFKVNGHNDLEFFLSIYPKSNCCEYLDYCSLYFNVEENSACSVDEIRIQLEMWIENSDGERTTKRATNFVPNGNITWGWTNFIKQEDLLKFSANKPIYICCIACPIIDCN
ncbi:hypothetical protein M3Y95_00082100 [Aphelenchoides besseyi]|nr:hypothetical protein M3Y95_00082100 [Aphelenchoides besseyi]